MTDSMVNSAVWFHALRRVCGRAIAVMLLSGSLGLMGLPAALGQAPSKGVDAVFEELFGRDLRKAMATRESDDDLALADRIFDAARETRGGGEHEAELRNLLCERAFSLALKSPRGADLASRIMSWRADRMPHTREESYDKIIKLNYRLYAMARSSDKQPAGERLLDTLLDIAQKKEAQGDFEGAIRLYRRAAPVAGSVRLATRDEITRTLDQVRRRQQAHDTLMEAKLRLEANPDDGAAAAEMFRVLLAELGDLGQAQHYAFLADETVRSMITMALGDPNAWSADDALKIADWLRQWAEQARTPSPARFRLMDRARTAYEVYLDQHQAEDLSHTKATLALKKIEEEMTAYDDLATSALSGRGSGFAGRRGTGIPRWPISSRGLVFRWANARDRRIKLQPRGEATINDQGQMSLAKGAMIVHGFNDVLLAACQKTHALTIEAIITPDTVDQFGPARIISFSTNGHSRNFTLGQEGDQLVLRLRTPATGENGSSPETKLGAIVAGKPHHVLVAYMPGKLVCFINGRKTADTDQVSGDFSNWSPQQLLFGDEFEESRDWAGRLQNVAIYNRFPSPKHVMRMYEAAEAIVQAGGGG